MTTDKTLYISNQKFFLCSAQVEPSTTEPIDTMNISAMPVAVKPVKKKEVTQTESLVVEVGNEQQVI